MLIMISMMGVVILHVSPAAEWCGGNVEMLGNLCNFYIAQ